MYINKYTTTTTTCEDAHCKIKSERLPVSQNCMLVVIVLDNKLVKSMSVQAPAKLQQ